MDEENERRERDDEHPVERRPKDGEPSTYVSIAYAAKRIARYYPGLDPAVIERDLANGIACETISFTYRLVGGTGR